MNDYSARIIRLEKSEEGTFGALLLNDKVFCVTLELPWRGNALNLSSIPATDQAPFLIKTGRYICVRRKSPLVAKLTKKKWDTTFEVTGVPGRTSILFHAGNFLADTYGCILLAQYWGKLRGDRAVLNSGETFNQFMLVTRNVEKFPLVILDAV